MNPYSQESEAKAGAKVKMTHAKEDPEAHQQTKPSYNSNEEFTII